MMEILFVFNVLAYGAKGDGPVKSQFVCVKPLLRGFNVTFGAAVGVGQAAFFANAFNDTGYRLPDVAIVQALANGTCAWNMSVGALTSGVVEGCATAWGNEAIFAGGHTNAGIYADPVDVFTASPPSKHGGGLPSVRKLLSTRLPVGRELLGCASAGNLTIFAGGKPPHPPAPFGETKRVDIWNHATMAWTSHNMSVERKKVEALAVGDEILMAGGEIGHHPPAPAPKAENDLHKNVGGYSSSVDVLNWKTMEWRVDSLALARQYFGHAAANGFAFFAGGFANDPPTSSGALGAGYRSSLVDIYHAATKTWSTAHLSVNRSNLMVRLYILFAASFPPSSLALRFLRSICLLGSRTPSLALFSLSRCVAHSLL